MSHIVDKNYDSGEDFDERYRVVQLPMFQVPAPPRIPELVNGALVAVGISQRLVFVQHQIDEVVGCYKSAQVIPYRYTLEAALVSMKRVLDDLVMSSYCMLNEEEVAKTHRLPVDTFGALFKAGRPTKVGKEVLERFFEPRDEFLPIFTEVVNSYKHSYLLSEAQTMWGLDFPTVVSIYAFKNDYSGEIIYHNHSLGHLLNGFNATVKQVVGRQRDYLEQAAPGDGSDSAALRPTSA